MELPGQMNMFEFKAELYVNHRPWSSPNIDDDGEYGGGDQYEYNEDGDDEVGDY